MSGRWGLTRKGRRSRQGVVWDGHGKNSLSLCCKVPEPWQRGRLALALTPTLSDLENHVQNDGGRAICLPQGGSTSSAPCTVEMCWEAGTCRQSAKFGGCGRPGSQRPCKVQQSSSCEQTGGWTGIPLLHVPAAEHRQNPWKKPGLGSAWG